MNNNINNISFSGYDVIPLKGLYMQGLKTTNERNIFKEMQKISQQEGLDLFINSTNLKLNRDLLAKDSSLLKNISIWAQDRKIFVNNSFGKQLLWNAEDKPMSQKEIEPLNNFQIKRIRQLPRGGNYYIGKNTKGEKWIIIKSNLLDNNKHASPEPTTTLSEIKTLFNIEPQNVIKLNISTNDDVDEIIRPMGYPLVMINDYQESYNNLLKTLIKYPNSTILQDIKLDLEKKISNPNTQNQYKEIYQTLKSNGFIPIKIGGRYSSSINYLNALAFENKSGKISYITNSTKGSYPELEELENNVENDILDKIPNISNIHYITGGKYINDKYINDKYHKKADIYEPVKNGRNGIMHILAHRDGGIHCMTSEIPDFEK